MRFYCLQLNNLAACVAKVFTSRLLFIVPPPIETVASTSRSEVQRTLGFRFSNQSDGSELCCFDRVELL